VHGSVRLSIRPGGFLELAELIDFRSALGEHGFNFQLASHGSNHGLQSADVHIGAALRLGFQFTNVTASSRETWDSRLSPHDFDGTMRMNSNRFRDTPYQQALQAMPAVGAEDNQIRSPRLCLIQNVCSRFSGRRRLAIADL